jgi:hypothetical protein
VNDRIRSVPKEVVESRMGTENCRTRGIDRQRTLYDMKWAGTRVTVMGTLQLPDLLHDHVFNAI